MICLIESLSHAIKIQGYIGLEYIYEMMFHRLVCVVLFLTGQSYTLSISGSCDVDPSSNVCMLSKIQALETDVQTLKLDQEPLKTEIQTLKQELQKYNTKGANCPTIAFRVQLTSNIHNPTQGFHIVYDDVKLNIGNAYNPQHGTFVAPTSGTYFLSFHVSISPGNTKSIIRIVMKRNGEIIAHSSSVFLSHWIADTFTDIVHLNAGDDVWIEVTESNYAFYIAGDSRVGPHSVFEGFLISC